MPSAKDILEMHGKLLLSDSNEADTRIKVIDRIIYDVLGWTHDDVTNEERVSEDGQTTYSDYILRTGHTGLVIEAKRVGESFNTDVTSRRSKLDRRLVTGPLGDAIKQARDYARKKSVGFAVVTNGAQWIVFPVNRVDGIEFSESSAILFPDLESILASDAEEFCELLSRDAVIDGALENALLGRIEDQLASRRLSQFYTTGFTKVKRNSLYPIIEPAIVTAFSEDIVNANKDHLKHCYVRTADRRKYDKQISMYIRAKETVLSGDVDRPIRDANAEPMTKMLTRSIASMKPLAMLAVGSVGAGKTTFLAYTSEVQLENEFEPRANSAYPHWIYVDFRSFSEDESSFDFLNKALFKYIQADPFCSDYDRCIKYAYRTEIDSLRRGPLKLLGDDTKEQREKVAEIIIKDYESVNPYVEKIIQYVAKNTPVFLVVDNIDQIDQETIQGRVFKDAMALGSRLSLNLILAIRETTFVNNRDLPIFNAFDFVPLYIDAPEVKSVLSRRFALSKMLMKDVQSSFEAENGARVNLSDSSIVIDMVQQSVLGTEVGELLDVLATSDIRLALRMTREFLQYGYTATGKALQIYQSTGRYILPRHEALRAIMLGNRAVYSDEYSVLGNPFDAKLSRSNAQLLRLYILAAIVSAASNASFQSMPGEHIARHLRSIGFGDDITLRVLSSLCQKRFIHTTSHVPASLEANYIPSRLGGYIIRYLIGDMMFLENIMMDTFISDSTTWDTLRSQTEAVYNTNNIAKRMPIRRLRVVTFFDAMEVQYEKLRSESVRRSLPMEWCTSPFAEIRSTFESRLKKVMASAKRNYGSALTKKK